MANACLINMKTHVGMARRRVVSICDSGVPVMTREMENLWELVGQLEWCTQQQAS